MYKSAAQPYCATSSKCTSAALGSRQPLTSIEGSLKNLFATTLEPLAKVVSVGFSKCRTAL